MLLKWPGLQVQTWPSQLRPNLVQAMLWMLPDPAKATKTGLDVGPSKGKNNNWPTKKKTEAPLPTEVTACCFSEELGGRCAQRLRRHD